jgi:membrane protein implicated in regulation of membrane protease activity
MHDLILTLHDLYIVPILYGTGILLILIDYFLPTDLACQFGYFSLAAAVFFQLNQSLMLSLTVAIAVWAVLLVLHFAVFHRFLTNVPGDSPTTTESR